MDADHDERALGLEGVWGRTQAVFVRKGVELANLVENKKWNVAQKHSYSTSARETNRRWQDILIFKPNVLFNLRIWPQVCVLSYVTKKFAVPETLIVICVDYFFTPFFFFLNHWSIILFLFLSEIVTLIIYLVLENFHNFYSIMQTHVIAGHLLLSLMAWGLYHTLLV